MTSSKSNPTRWTLIVRAQGAGPDARRALGELIRQYESFILWLIRRYQHPPDTHAEDLKQAFLAAILEKNDIARLDRERGSFRGWLRVRIGWFLGNEWEKWNAPTSGRSKTDLITVDSRQLTTLEDDVCHRAFAMYLVQHVLSQLRDEAKDLERFDHLVRFLPGPQADIVPYEAYARSIGMTSGALKRAVCEKRNRFRTLLRAAIRDSLDLGTHDAGPDDPAPESSPPDGSERRAEAERVESRAIDDELRELLRYFEQREGTDLLLEAT
jgi:hypothetical protein